MSAILEVNADNWEKEVLQSESLVVVEFWHEQCVFCKVLAPIFAELAEEYKGKVKFITLNVFANPENQYITFLLGVMSTPTLVFFCKGRPISATIGVKSKENLKQLVEDLYKNHEECINKSTELKITP
jgi:thioredoxin 1